MSGRPQDWREALRAAPRRAAARAERDLFRVLNPGMSHAPIMKQRPRTYRPASVLIPVIDRPHGPTVLLTVRTDGMPSHAGQIGLPGGGPKPGEDAVDAALREAWEEVGIAPGHVEVTGTLGVHLGGLGFAVTPVIGLVHTDADMQPCPREVAEMFEVPLSVVTDRARHLVVPKTFSGTPYRMYAMPYTEEDGRERDVWGLTAGILETFCRAYRDDPLPEAEQRAAS